MIFIFLKNDNKNCQFNLMHKNQVKKSMIVIVSTATCIVVTVWMSSCVTNKLVNVVEGAIQDTAIMTAAKVFSIFYFKWMIDNEKLCNICAYYIKKPLLNTLFKGTISNYFRMCQILWWKLQTSLQSALYQPDMW